MTLEAAERVTDVRSAVSGAMNSAGRFARWWSLQWLVGASLETLNYPLSLPDPAWTGLAPPVLVSVRWP